MSKTSLFLCLSALLIGFCYSRAVYSIDLPVQVEAYSLPLGTQKSILVDGTKVINVFSSSDRIVSATLEGPNVLIEARDFGEATVTAFTESGNTAIYRITIAAQDINIPAPSHPKGAKYRPDGWHAKVGTSIGWRSEHGLFENLVMQQEQASLYIPGSTSHDLEIKTSRPLLYDSPKPDRFVDTISYHYLNKQKLSVRLGDADPLIDGMRHRGPVRGARIDLPYRTFRPYLVGGVVHNGVSDPFWGDKATALYGGGAKGFLSKHLSLFGQTLFFDRNENLRLNRRGWEAKVGASYRQGVVQPFDVAVTVDEHFRYAVEADTSLDLSPVSLSLSAGHSEADMEVYSLPNRFGSGFDSYSAIASLAPKESDWQLGGSIGKTISFSTQDEFAGRSRLVASSLSFSATPWESYKTNLYFNRYESDFTPFNQGTATREEGTHVENINELTLTNRNSLTLSFDYSKLQSGGLGVDYEKEHITTGWRHRFSDHYRDNIHVEAGLSHIGSQNNLVQEGTFLLAKASAIYQREWVGLEGVIQNELGLTETDSRSHLRGQLGVVFTPTPQHNLRVSLFHDFDWYKDIYTNSRGFYLGYTFHFGSAVPTKGLFSSWKRYDLKGRVFKDQNGDGKFSSSDQPYPLVKIQLEDPSSGEQRTTLTDKGGFFAFEGLKAGTKRLALDRKGIKTAARLTTPSPFVISLDRGDETIDFIFSDMAQVQGIFFSDLNQNGKADEEDPVVTGIRLKYRSQTKQSWETISSHNGRYTLSQLPPGKVQLRVDLDTLPPGFRADRGTQKSLTVKPNQFIRQNFALTAQRTVSGILFIDTNNNRTFDDGEKRLDNKTVEFLGFKTQTGDGGRFLFRNLPPGKGDVHYRKSKSEPVILERWPANIINVYLPVREYP